MRQPKRGDAIRKGSPGCRNRSTSSYPIIRAVRNEIQKHVIINMPEADRLYHEVLPYLTEQAYFIPVPATYNYSLWWPWVKNHNGENPLRLATCYQWLDQDLRQEMTGRR
jgi:hypothetical protein